MARLVIIVSQKEPHRYPYLKHVFASETMEVMLDRRLEERRQRRVPSAGDKRRADRRVRDVSKDLQTYGWALVHR